MGDSINIFLDNLNALLTRLYIFPLPFQILIWILILLSPVLCTMLFFKRMLKLNTSLPIKFIIFGLYLTLGTLVAITVSYDNKLHIIQLETFRYNKNHFTNKITSIKIEKSDTNFFVFNKALSKLSFADTTMLRMLQSQPGLQVVELTTRQPKISAFFAIIDLNLYNVVLDTDIVKKERTSEFCKRYNADIAVNGEAGMSPSDNAPLGIWTGNYIVNKKIILLHDTKDRPFMYFDAHSKAYYSPDAEVIKNTNSNMINAIWGRFDLIVNNKIQIDPADLTKKNPYPRTIVGIDNTQQKIALLVVDGRRPEYSTGMTMLMCAEVMQKLGCANAMACDQGGSSMMYSKVLNVVNLPADGHERKVYTHLAFRKK